MSVARTGALPDSYKYYTITIDSFDNRLLSGQVFHDSLDQGMAFKSLSEMTLLLEGLFDKLHYPMKSVDQRNFNKKPADIRIEEPQHGTRTSEGIKGKLGEFRLHVKYRFHATWQGDIRNLRNGETHSFLSFLELMEYFSRELGPGPEDNPYGLGKKMCEVVVRNYDNFIMKGDISHPAVEQRELFCNEFDIKEAIEHMLNPLPEGTDQGNIIIPRTVTVCAGNFGPATFVVRVLFRRNSTWKGIICWKERRRQINFRSFMEMILLIQDAVLRSDSWKEEDSTEAANLA